MSAHRTTTIMTEIDVPGVTLKPEYRAGEFRPTRVEEVLQEFSELRFGEAQRYTVTFTGPILKKDGSDSMNHGKRQFGLFRDAPVSDIPRALAVLLQGQDRLKAMSF